MVGQVSMYVPQQSDKYNTDYFTATWTESLRLKYIPLKLMWMYLAYDDRRWCEIQPRIECRIPRPILQPAHHSQLEIK
jgi:hypothetical protein